MTPWPEFEESTGYLYLTDGTCRKIICRVGDDGKIYLLWRKRGIKTEVGYTLRRLLRAIRKS